MVSARPSRASEFTISVDQLLSFWCKNQGLAERSNKSLDRILASMGWTNTAGSAGPYVSFLARGGRAGSIKNAVDDAIFGDGSLVEVPSLRGCTMLVPREDVNAAIAAGRPFHAERKKKVYKFCKVTDGDIFDLSNAIVKILAKEPMDTNGLQKSLPSKLVRSLGEDGRRLGESSTLTLALRDLQAEGKIQRLSALRRLDTKEFTYRIAPWSLGDREPVTNDSKGLLVELARRFFTFAGPATLKDFAWWAGVAQRDAREALPRAGVVNLSVDDYTEEAWVAQELLHDVMKAKPVAAAPVRFLPFRDNYLYFRRGLSIFVRDAGSQKKVLDWVGKPASLDEIESIHHHAIVSAGELVGVWEFDAERRCLEWATFQKITTALGEEIEAVSNETEQFISQALDDVLFYSMDNEKNRQARLAAVRALKSEASVKSGPRPRRRGAAPGA